MATKGRKPVFRFNVLNVKLFSNTRQNPEGYIQLFLDLISQRQLVKVSEDRVVGIKSIFRSTYDPKIIYGRIARFTNLEEGTLWFNTQTLDFEEFQTPPDLFPNAKDSDFIFFAEQHRLVLRKDPKGVSLSNSYKYFQTALAKVALDNEQLYVNIESSKDIYERITSAEELRSIEISISYTNDDSLANITTRLLERVMKETNVAVLDIKAKADQGESIDLNNNPILSSALDLSQNNGTAKARIVNENNVAETINTDNHPREETIKGVEDDTPSEWVPLVKNFVESEYPRD